MMAFPLCLVIFLCFLLAACCQLLNNRINPSTTPMSLYSVQYLKLKALKALHPFKLSKCCWLTVSLFPIFSFLCPPPHVLHGICSADAAFTWVLCMCFLIPGRRNHFAYFNYHTYEGNAVI